MKPSEFHAQAGVEDWRVMLFIHGACAYYRTGTLAAGARVVAAVAGLTGAADVDLRPEGVMIRLPEHDPELARKVSAAARELGGTPDPTQLTVVQIAIDALVTADVLPFWQAVLGYDEFEGTDVLDPHRRNPPIWFQDMDAPRPQRNRIHLDVSVPHDQAEARVAAAVAAGGRVVYDKGAPTWWTLADPEGNEVDITSWVGRD